MKNTPILVLGTGELGLSVLRNLARCMTPASGATVTVLLHPSTIDSRDFAKQREIAELRDLGISFFAADLAAPGADLVALFRGFHTLIGCTGFRPGGGLQLSLARAVIEAGVKRYFPWQPGLGCDAIGRERAQDLFDEQLDVSDLLKAQERTEWVVVSTGTFSSFFFEPALSGVDLVQNTACALGSWNTAARKTPEEVGALTAEICLFQPRIANRIVHAASEASPERRWWTSRPLGWLARCAASGRARGTWKLNPQLAR